MVGSMAARSIAISPRVMQLAEDCCAGLLLCQLIYWTRRGTDKADRQGWVFKTAEEWQHETGMSWKVQHRARDVLARKGLIEERKRVMPARLEFRVNLLVLGPLLGTAADADLVRSLDMGLFIGSDAVADRLMGRGGYLYHTILARIWPVPTAMLCSRLLAGVRLPGAEDLTRGGKPGSLGETRLVALQRNEWVEQTGLSREQWQTARRNLRDRDVLIERCRNFPRRVDLALDLDSLAKVLTAIRQPVLGPDSSEAGRERAKQVGGIGRCLNPPTESPFPAFRNRPKQPLEIAQSRLYLQELNRLHKPQPLAGACEATATAAATASDAGGGWGGKGDSGKDQKAFADSGAPALPASPSSTATPSTPEPTATALERNLPLDASPAHERPEPLIWPAFFTPGDKASATKHLAGLERAIQQTVLDEIDWMQQGNKVRSPVALARALCHQARNDLLVPDGAHRIREARERARAATAAATGFAGPAGAGQVKALPAATRPQGATAERINRLLGRMA